MKRYTWILFLIMLLVAMMAGMAGCMAMAEEGQCDPVDYLKATLNGSAPFPISYTTESCDSYTIVTDSTTDWVTGWYVVSADTTIDERISVQGDVNLILCDGATLTASMGITVGWTHSLTVYSQSSDVDTMGKLIADNSGGTGAGIGGIDSVGPGTVVICGGDITANGGGACAGIGGGRTTTQGSGKVAIYGGNVTAIGGEEASEQGVIYGNGNGIGLDGIDVNDDMTDGSAFHLEYYGVKMWVSNDNTTWTYYSGTHTRYMKAVQLKGNEEIALITEYPKPRNLIYNGYEQELVIPGEVVGGMMAYSYNVYDVNGFPYSNILERHGYTTSIPTGKDPGVYEIICSAIGDENHLDLWDIKRIYTKIAPVYSVTLSGGDNATASGGATSQTGLTGAMEDVVYTANDGYYFPENYSVATVNGISVTRNSYTQITVSGTPTDTTEITITTPTAKATPDAPTTAIAVNCTTAENNDGKLTGVTTDMEYKKSDATSWVAGTGDDIGNLIPGTYYVRLKATDTTNASGSQELTIADYLTALKNAAKDAVNAVDANDYIEADRQIVTNAKNTALAAIEAATTESEVTTALNTFYTVIGNCTTYTAEMITQVMSEVSAKTGSDAAYTGNPIQLVNAPTTVLPEGYIMKYAVTTENTAPADNLYTTSIPTATEAGTYYVWYRVTGDKNQLDTDPSVVMAVIYPRISDISFRLPALTGSIEERAFEGDTGITSVYAPDSCISIGQNAFKGCANLFMIRLPGDCSIAENAFTGCADLVTIIAPAGGTTEEWCRDREGILFIPEE